MALYTLYGISYGATGGAKFVQVQSQRMNSAIQHLLEAGDGSVDAKHISVSEQKPTITFTSTDIKGVLDMFNTVPLSVWDGKAIQASPTTDGPLTLYFRKRGVGAAFLGTLSHVAVAVTAGLMRVTGIRATHPQAATIDVEVTVVWDGSANDPVTIQRLQNLPALDPTANVIWTLGPWKMQGVFIPDFTDMTIDIGSQVETVAADGNIWPTHAHISQRRPTISGTTLRADIIDKADGFDQIGAGGQGPAGFGILGVERTAATEIYLRKKLAGGGVVPDATAEHIKFAVNKGRMIWTDASAQTGQNAALSVQIMPIFDGTNAIIVVSTAVAIA